MDLPTPQCIVLTRLSHLGDVVHAVPVFHALRTRWPEAHLTWVVQPEFAPLIRGLEGLDAVVLFDRIGGLAAWRRLNRALKQSTPDLAVDAQGNWKSGIVCRISRAKRRLGLAREQWQEPTAAFLMTDHAPAAFGRHAVHKMNALLDAIDATATANFDLCLTEAESRAGENEYRRRCGEAGGRRWILHLGRAGDPRTWPADHFASLARALAVGQDRVVLISGPGETEQGRCLEQALGEVPGVSHWVGQSDLRVLAAFFSHSAKAGARFVGGDSGPAHVAAACGLPVSMLCGPQDPGLTGPWPLPEAKGSPNQVVQADAPALGPINSLSVPAVLGQLRGCAC